MDKRIEEYIRMKNNSGGTASIVIAGCSCSGKTTLAEEIKAAYGGEMAVGILHEDDYFKDLPDIPKTCEGVFADHIEAFWCKEFRSDAETLITQGRVYTPVYDMSVNKRTNNTKQVMKGLVNIFEGLHAITILKDQIECLAVYLDPGYDECMKRRAERDAKMWNADKDSVMSYWLRCIRPMNTVYVEPQLKKADIIITQ